MNTCTDRTCSRFLARLRLLTLASLLLAGGPTPGAERTLTTAERVQGTTTASGELATVSDPTQPVDDLVADLPAPAPGIEAVLSAGEDIIVTVPHDLGKAAAVDSLFPSEAIRQAFLDTLNGESPAALDLGLMQPGGEPPAADGFDVMAVVATTAEEPGLLEHPDLQQDDFAVYNFTPPANSVMFAAGSGTGPDPSSTFASIDGGGGGGGVPTGPTVYQGPEQNYVLRYVCCAQLPMIQDPTLPAAQLFADDNVVAVPEQNELVAVFDDLPVYNGQQLFVRVQRSGGNHYWGWFPLFWLHEKAAPVVESEIRTNASYMAIARGIRDMASDVFYKNCNGLHPAGGEPEWPMAGAPGENHKCGEYPIGATNDTLSVNGHHFRFLEDIQKTVSDYSWQPDGILAYPRFGYLDNDGTADIQLEIPFAIGPVATQQRPNDEYGIYELTDPDYQFFTRTYWQSEYAQADEHVRVHPMDWYFKTWYPNDAPAQPHEVNFSMIVNLPGFEVYSPWFEKEIVIWHTPLLGTTNEARTSEIRLGGMRIDEIPLRVDGKVFLKTAQNDGEKIDDLTLAGGMVGVEFTDVVFTRVPNITFFDGVSVKFKKKDAGLLNLAIDTLMSSLNALLLSGDEDFSFGGLLFWSAVHDQLRDQILTSLQDLAPRLTQVFEAPRGRAIAACSAVMPASYKDMTSPYYAFYRNCRDFGATLSDIAFVNPPNAPVQINGNYGESPDAWGNVNIGGIPWGGPDTDNKTWWCPNGGGAGCSITFDRPWWAHYNPKYSYVGGAKFHPDSYNYAGGPGVKVGLRASGETIRDYWYFLQCLVPGADRKLNASPQATTAQLRNALQDECRLPALETVCELYGEGDDLESMWYERWGYTPSLSGYATYCAWAEELKNEGKYPNLSVNPGPAVPN